MSHIKAFLFDVDGTLADTEEVHRIAFNKAFAQAGLPWNWSRELYNQLLAVTGGKERIQYFVNDFLAKEQRPQGDLPELAKKLHLSKTEFYVEIVQQGGLPLRPGVKRLLEEARAKGILLGIATTTSIPNVHTLLESSLGKGSQDWFAVIAAGDLVKHKKPAADIYEYALQQLNLQPEECLAFEDSENGLKSARAALLTTIITHNPFTMDHDFDGAALVLSDFGEPHAPFTLIAGDAFGKEWFDVELAERILAEQLKI